MMPAMITRLMATTAAILLMLSSASLAQTPGAVPAPPGCAALLKLQLPGVALAITRAEWFPAGTTPAGAGAAASTIKLPAYCRIDGVIDRRVGAAGVSYGIGFALALPDNWNGRFLFQGGGGLNGSVQMPLGAQAAGGNPGLARGFAVVSTDTGHQGRGAVDAGLQEKRDVGATPLVPAHGAAS